MKLRRQAGDVDLSHTFQVYGGWVREMGADAAQPRERWAEETAAKQADG